MILKTRRFSGRDRCLDDAYIGGERTGEGAGRGRRGHTPFIIAVETSADGRPLQTRLQVVRGFQAGETKRLCARVAAGTTVVSDGGQWFRCIAEQPGIVHERHVTGSDHAAARHPAFHWASTMLANINNSLLVTHRVVGAKHLPRYTGRLRLTLQPTLRPEINPRAPRHRGDDNAAVAQSPRQIG